MTKGDDDDANDLACVFYALMQLVLSLPNQSLFALFPPVFVCVCVYLVDPRSFHFCQMSKLLLAHSMPNLVYSWGLITYSTDIGNIAHGASIFFFDFVGYRYIHGNNVTLFYIQIMSLFVISQQLVTPKLTRQGHFFMVSSHFPYSHRPFFFALFALESRWTLDFRTKHALFFFCRKRRTFFCPPTLFALFSRSSFPFFS